MIGRHGLVLGKFLPPHAGHAYLIEVARRCVDELTVVVGTLAREPIAGELRVAWMRELFPAVRVAHLADENPQDPSEHPQFWEIWKASLQRVLPSPVDRVFASEAYGARLAAELGAQFVPIDPRRGIVPVSGTAVRADPFAHWRHLPPPVRAHYARRVCVFGPESTGKSTLAAQLAAHYDTALVPEYARTYLEQRGRPPVAEDMPVIARCQVAAEDTLARICHRVLVTDTDALTTKIWSEVLFGSVSPEVAALAARRYDLTIVTDADIPYTPDPVRYLPDRAAFLARCVAELEARDRRYVIVRGDRDARLRQAIAAIQL
jgi:HTH-type transcriptional repressor of NAD biosynthesis genes